MKNLLLLSCFVLLFSISAIGQTYTSLDQHHLTPDGTEKLAYHKAKVTISKENINLKIVYDDFPDRPWIFTLEKINTIKLSQNRGTTIQYRTLPDLNYSYINYNIILITTYNENNILEKNYTYNYEVAMLQQLSDNSIEVMDRFFIKR